MKSWKARFGLGAVALLAPAVCSAQDWSQTVQNALAAAGNHNVVVDTTGFTGPKTSSVNPFANLASGASANVVVKIGCYDLTATVPWDIKASHVRVEFCTPQSKLQAGSGFPAGPLITVGDNTFPIQDVLIQYGYLDCAGVSNCTAYVGNSLNEFAGLRHVNIANTSGGPAVQINGTAQTMGHYILEDLQIVNVGANDCISITANGLNQHRLRDITCNNTSPVGKAAVHVTAVGSNETLAVVEHLHAEGFNDGVFFDNHVHGSLVDVDCTNNCAQAVHIGALSGSDITVVDASVTTAPIILKNDFSGHNVPRPTGGEIRTLSFYAQSNYGGNPAEAVYWNGKMWVIQ